MAIVNPMQSKGGAGVGARLREVKEEEEQGLRGARPSALPGSPLRQLVRTTLMGNLPRGVAPVLRMQPEPEVAAPVIPAQAITPATGQPPMGAQRPEMSYAVAPPMADGGGGVGAPPGGGGAPAPQAQGAPQPQGAPAYTSGGQVRGASTQAAPAQIGSRFQSGTPARPYPTEYNIPAPIETQSPLQHILGGIGKWGTDITSQLNLPQLMPGGFFADLQRRMGPLQPEKGRGWGLGWTA